MDVLGLKVKLLGDAILDADTWVPQVALGLEHKQVRPGSLQSVLDFLGTKTSGTDLYLSATKLLLDKSLLLNTTLRYTNANQNGLLGWLCRAWQEQPQPAARVFDRLPAAAQPCRGGRVPLQAQQPAGPGCGSRPWGACARTTGRMFSLPGRPARMSRSLAWVDLGRIVPGVTGTGAKPVTTFRPRSRSDRAGFHLLELHHDYPTLRMGCGRSLPAGPARRRANSPDPFIHRARRLAPGAGRKAWHHAPGR
jgi:hypothetical protein